ncbi:NAD(P)-dependent oxidoreductase [Nanoarchaeota archaeon]
MKIVFFDIQGWEKKYIDKELKGHKVVLFKEPLNSETVKAAKDANIVSVFVKSKIDKEVLKKMPKLKMIVTRSTGFDHIDVKACKKKKINVTYIPSYGENTVAEHAFALILSMSRNIYKATLKMRNEDFTIDESLKGFDLKGKTLGVVGAGKIGTNIIRMAKGFDMNVCVYTRHPKPEMAKEMGFKFTKSLKELLGQSDIITLHVPYNKETHHMINKKSIKWIKKGARLINTARGGLVDNDALIEALDKGIISEIGVDVLETEELLFGNRQSLFDLKKSKMFNELIKDYNLMHRPNVLFTPHMAFYSEEALVRIIKTTIQNIHAFLAKKPINLVK